MLIWLITLGEPLSSDNLNTRLLRTGIVANLLLERGHKVVWWTSTFDHVLKKQRFDEDTTIILNDRFCIKLLHSVKYKKNVSIRRIINHCGIARKFNRLSESEIKPDIILCSLPTLELSKAAAEYGKKNGVPVVLDVRDLWPDIFLRLVPHWAKSCFKLLLFPMFKTVRIACTEATSIVGITPAFVDWGVNYASRVRTSLDRDFPLGYSSVTPQEKALIEANRFWKKYGLCEEEFIICFFGTMGRQFEFETVIEAARKLNSQRRLFRFILCGSGDNFEYYKKLASGVDNTVFPGWVGAVEIWSLMRMSAVGLAPYRSNEDFMASLPNKSIEYLSAGLPIISSLKGILKDLLSTSNCGITYENSNSDELVSILIDLYDHPERLKTISENALDVYKEKFVAEKVYNDMIDYLESVHSNYRKTGGHFIEKLPGSN